MTRRSTVLVTLLTLLTCGLYGLWWMWSTTRELREETGRAELTAGLDVLLTVVTFGLWAVYVGFRNARAVHESLATRGYERNDRSAAIGAVSGLAWFSGFGTLLTVALLQEEYNAMARLTTSGPAATSPTTPSPSAPLTSTGPVGSAWSGAGPVPHTW